MREIPILYSTAMVQAKLAGRKMMTRRTTGLDLINSEPERWEFIRTAVGSTTKGPGRTFALFRFIDGKEVWLPCPYGKPGDILWVRETFWHSVHDWDWSEVFFKADLPNTHPMSGWKPSIHMPKAAARIWDEVVSVKVERVQDITEEDAINEGIEPDPLGPDAIDGGVLYPGLRFFNYAAAGYRYVRPLESFRSLWIKINGEESWNLNPFVWVISTKNLSTTGKPERLCQ